MPPCERTREHTNPAGSTLNPKVEGSNPSRPTSKFLQIGRLPGSVIAKGGSEADVSELTLARSCEIARTSTSGCEPEG
jgi:hypothetical protein